MSNPETALVARYKPTPAEETASAAYNARRAKKPSVRVKVEKKGTSFAIRPDHPDLRTGYANLVASFGTGSPEFSEGLLRQIADATKRGKEPDADNINFALAVVAGIEPRDEIEAMLAAQMAAVHMATMTFARRLAHTETLPQQDSAERALNKLARTFTTQMEALKRHRSTGQQTVRVERVTVEAGGQAIVGAINTPGGGGGCDGI